MRPYGTLTTWLLTLLLPTMSWAQEQEQPDNSLTIDANLMTRGELRYGGLPSINDVTKDEAQFVMARTRLSVGFERSFLQAKITAQHSGVWGQQGKGSLNLYETWAKLKANNGLFTVIGRQELAYDDERILGRNDWSVTASSHDALKLGYEGHGHKAHVILAYNQRSENTNGGTTYTTTDGSQVYKSMIAGWYHYDLAHVPLGASLLFMNLALQNSEETDPKTEHQQLLGGFVKFTPHRWNIEAAYYHQMGKDEFHIPISAWMASIKTDYSPTPKWRLSAGFDHLSGDDNPIVPKIGDIGLTYHEKVRGFNALNGTHHKFYGAMDFFYANAYYGGYTPGLQNLYTGFQFAPMPKFDVSTFYHYLATASKIHDAERTLGHEIEFAANYLPIKDVKFSIGYTYMHGTPTLERLQRIEGKNNLHWAWLMLVINPRIFTFKW